MLNVVKAIRAATGMSIREAVDVAEDRRRLLRERRPEDFLDENGPDGPKTWAAST